MKKKTIVWIAVLAVAGILIGFCVGTYNSLNSKSIAIEEKEAVIQTQLQRRVDLIPNLVNTVKGYSDHESTTLQAVTEARSALQNAQGVQQQAEANQRLDSAWSIYVNAVTEAYPELKSNQQYTDLMTELSGTENRIAVARKDYNEAVSTYNRSVRRFPNNLLAGLFGFEKAAFFEASQEAQKAPEVSFD